MRSFATLLLTVSSAAHAVPPHQCGPAESSFTIAAAEYEPVAKPYVDCLGSAKQRYGFNDGPFAIYQCKAARSAVLARTKARRLTDINYLLKQIDREMVWMIWCSTDVGSELPANIKIQPNWPQAQTSRNADAPNR